jgi:predicted nuclease of predicted toxin-antitoxin system
VSGPPSFPTFFVDRSLGRHKVADALRQAGQAAVSHDTVFPQDTKDPTWLSAVGAKGWVVLTKDKHIRTRRNELASLLNAGVAAFVLTSGNITGEQMAAAFTAAIPQMLRLLISTARPFIARVTTAGGVQLIALKKM